MRGDRPRGARESKLPKRNKPTCRRGTPFVRKAKRDGDSAAIRSPRESAPVDRNPPPAWRHFGDGDCPSHRPEGSLRRVLRCCDPCGVLYMTIDRIEFNSAVPHGKPVVRGACWTGGFGWLAFVLGAGSEGVILARLSGPARQALGQPFRIWLPRTVTPCAAGSRLFNWETHGLRPGGELEGDLGDSRAMATCQAAACRRGRRVQGHRYSPDVTIAGRCHHPAQSATGRQRRRGSLTRLMGAT